MDNPISIKFGEPKHGWLPVDFIYQNFRIDFTASDVLNNPIEELYNAVTKLQDNNPRQIIWWLEPGAYFFDLEKNGSNITLTISETDDLHNGTEEKRVLCTISTHHNRIIKPFIAALQSFSAQTYTENDWPYKLEEDKVRILKTY
jgi:hypothetical protein